MIQSHADYLAYLKADQAALQQHRNWKALLFDDVWRFQRLLRKLEYLINCRGNRLLRAWTNVRFRRLSRQLGFSIPPNVFGPGLAIAHAGTIIINDHARIGANCRLQVCVVIGTQAGHADAAPQIGNNCYIGPGAKLFGRIQIGDNTAIGANAVVNKDFPAGHVTLVGAPARIVSDKGSAGLLIQGYPT